MTTTGLLGDIVRKPRLDVRQSSGKPGAASCPQQLFARLAEETAIHFVDERERAVGPEPADDFGLVFHDRPIPLLALAQRLLGPQLGQRHGQVAGQPFPQRDGLGREHALAPVVQLQQAQPLLAHAQRNQGHRFVASPLQRLRVRAWRSASVVVASSSVVQLRPETAVRREEGLRRVEPAADHVAAHALDDRIARAVAHELAGRVAVAEVVLQPDELRAESRAPRSTDSRRRRAAGCPPPRSPTARGRSAPPPGSVPACCGSR